MSKPTITLPAGNAHFERALDAVSGEAIGVTISLLVLQEDFDRLPELFRVAAQQTFERSAALGE